MSLHKETQKEFMVWVKAVLADPFAALPGFCDWCDEQGIRSQKWREVLALLPKAVFWEESLHAVEIYTKQRCIRIVEGRGHFLSNKLRITIAARPKYKNDEYLLRWGAKAINQKQEATAS